ncbi:MAG: ImmA/IrrE family metallo-endopeptidase [Acidobacteriota bacterium]
MELQVITSRSQYEKYRAEAERLIALDPDPATPDGNRLEVIAVLLETYEKKQFPIETPDPIEAILFRMDEQGLRQRDLIPYIGSKSKVSEVLSRSRPLTLRMIRALHSGLGIPARVLLQETSKSESEFPNWKKFPLGEMVERGWVPATPQEIRQRPAELLQAFFASFEGRKFVPALFRRKIHQRSGLLIDTDVLLAWTVGVLIKAREEAVPEYNSGSVTTDLLKELAHSSMAEDGPLKAKKVLARVGIVLVIEPPLSKISVDGAAMLSEAGNPVIALTLRYDRIDNFWFTLFHELAHVALHLETSEESFVDDLDIDQEIDPIEREADKFARDALIPRSIWRRSDAFRERTPRAVEELSQQLRIHPAIIAGRIRKETNNYQILSQLVGHGKVRKLFSR